LLATITRPMLAFTSSSLVSAIRPSTAPLALTRVPTTIGRKPMVCA